jgi:hypothetical protein
MGSKKKRPAETMHGSYSALYHAVLESVAFKGASSSAKALLMDVLRQHNGRNNGHFQLTTKWLLKDRGWKSADTIQKAKLELLERGLIVKTRQGGLSMGPDRFAVTWLNISDFTGLDVTYKSYVQGAWRNMDLARPIVSTTARTGSRNEDPRIVQPENQSETVPDSGTEPVLVTPVSGAMGPLRRPTVVPKIGNNEYCQLPALKRQVRVVGKKGRSGVRKNPET